LSKPTCMDESGWQGLTPLIVTAGDPTGIGPEVVHKALAKLHRKGEIFGDRPIIVIADAVPYARHLEKPSAMHLYRLVPAEDFLFDPDYFLCHFAPEKDKPWRPLFLDCGERNEQRLTPGKPSRHSGDRALTYLGAATELLSEGAALAVCTAPISKKWVRGDDFPYPGQTEMFADVWGVERAVMMLVGGGLRVALVTIHEPLGEVAELLSRKLVRQTVEITEQALREDFGIARPRIAVCGLNPHAGEEGGFGKEESRIITPACKSLRMIGIEVDGPLAADSVFHFAMQGRYDAVVAMYHDQGLIPVKTAAFHKGVNVTLGLPIIRTSPDHGTAFDIAGKGEADEGAMLEALRLAHSLCLRREEQLLHA
jgi:4-hydroxythreonine-4-phosphate dehydrogenase